MNPTVHKIIEEMDTPSERCEAVRMISSAQTLLELAYEYNWDDGLDLPLAIIEHESCDLGLALHLFELAEGVVWLTSEREWKYQKAWAEFCKELSSRIENGMYAPGVIEFQSKYSKVQIYKANKDGVNEIYFTSVP